MTIRPSFDEEKVLWKRGFTHVLGIDEVGRGAFAGPVVAAAVIYPTFYPRKHCRDVRDSKQLSPLEREELSPIISTSVLWHGVVTIGVPFIDKEGIGRATHHAMRALITKALRVFPAYSLYVLVDGFHVRYIQGINGKQRSIVKGDQKSISIAAASILAKVHRDNLMKTFHSRFPEYNFKKNKGYGTAEHRYAIAQHGLSTLHRQSFDIL